MGTHGRLIGRSFRSRRLCAAVMALVGAAGWLLAFGCESSQKQADDDLSAGVMRPAERLAKATELAEKAEESRRRGDTDKALSLYRESIDVSGELPLVWNNYGVLLMDQQQYDSAVSAFNVAAQLQPTDPRPYTNVGIAYRRAGWAEDALRHFERALEVDPGHMDALRGAIEAAATLQRFETEDLERVRRALLRETDPEWRRFMERQRFLLENRIRRAQSSYDPTYSAEEK